MSVSEYVSPHLSLMFFTSSFVHRNVLLWITWCSTTSKGYGYLHQKTVWGYTSLFGWWLNYMFWGPFLLFCGGLASPSLGERGCLFNRNINFLPGHLRDFFLLCVLICKHPLKCSFYLGLVTENTLGLSCGILTWLLMILPVLCFRVCI